MLYRERASLLWYTTFNQYMQYDLITLKMMLYRCWASPHFPGKTRETLHYQIALPRPDHTTVVHSACSLVALLTTLLPLLLYVPTHATPQSPPKATCSRPPCKRNSPPQVGSLSLATLWLGVRQSKERRALPLAYQLHADFRPWPKTRFRQLPRVVCRLLAILYYRLHEVGRIYSVTRYTMLNETKLYYIQWYSIVRL